MIGKSDRNINKLILSLLLLSGLAVSLFSQDKQISGVINVYRRVVAIGPGLDNVTLNSVDSISPGDTVLLIQMQGVGILTDQDGYGIAVQSKLGEPGGYEFLLVQSVDGGTKRVVFRNNILNTFDIRGNVQLIRVPFYNSATVTGKLTAKSWDNAEKTGGVLAMIVGRKLKLVEDIDVSGKGFWGGKDTIGTGECVEINYSANNRDSYPRTWLNAGFKGEGLAIHDQLGNLLAPLHMKGQGINLTGGGGGNGKYSGGGGGSNRGKGGDGSFEKNFGTGACSDPQPGAYGGTTLTPTIISGGIFLGGGGGSSTRSPVSTGSSGGRGGGIVIIVADTISGNRKSFKADGATALNAVSDAGAGGGGAGGSVIISLQSFSLGTSDSLKISVKGGNGGTNPGGFGNGGGGGGGLFWVSTTVIPGKVPVKVNYGIPGPTTLIEGNGEIKYSFTPKLNGFLFNSIRSRVTGDQVDSICSNVVFGQITGTKPVGGVAPHTYQWQRSTTSESAGYSPAPGINNGQDYSPGLLTQTSWFRRIVTDNGAPALVDISKAVKIIVQPFIKNNIVGTSDTICFAQDPPSFTSKAVLQDGNGIYAFRWEVSTDNSLFSLPVNIYNTEGYTPPPALGMTSWYRRTVTSGRCVDASAIVKITVLDTIKDNRILNSPPDICYGMTFANLTSTDIPVLAGGDNSYRFRWESNINGAGWGLAPGVSNGVGYNPPELPQRAPSNEYYYRRVVYSGIDNVCVNTSNTVLLKDFPVLTNNIITTPDQTICFGDPLTTLIGSDPLNGDGINYSYRWQDSTKLHTWTDIPGQTGHDYQPPSPPDTTRFRRIVSSSACSDISKSIIVNVHKPILNNIISLLAGGATDTTICNGQLPHLLKGTVATGGTNIPGDYAYQWKYSFDNVTWIAVPAAGTGTSYQPPALTTSTYYKRWVRSGACDVPSSATINITVLPLITNNSISANQAVCYNTIPALLTGATLSGGAGPNSYSYSWEQSTDGTAWSIASGSSNSLAGYQPPALTVPMKYKRIVKSGLYNCCISTSNVIDIGINPLPVSPIYAGPDANIKSLEKTFHMAADPPLSGETGSWTVINPTTALIDNISNNLTVVRNLSIGKNTFLWTITNGPCELKDSVNIYVIDEFIPQGFSPNNNDDINNTFSIEGLDLPTQIAELRVVNGAGAEVYLTNNQDGREWTDWDGKNSRGIDLPEGTYYYLLKVTSKETGQVFRRSGFIVLKRY